MSQELDEKNTTIRPDLKRPGTSSSSYPGGMQVLGPALSQSDGSGRAEVPPQWNVRMYSTAWALMGLS